MRHRKHTSKLNRTSEHRAALLRNLAAALITNERIRTTKVKAQQLRPFVESLVTLSREASLHNKRLVISRLQDKNAAFKLFQEIGPRVGQRPGGYLRIVQDGPRMGDGAPMAYIEFVDAAQVAEGDQPVSMKQKLKQRQHQARKERAKARANA